MRTTRSTRQQLLIPVLLLAGLVFGGSARAQPKKMAFQGFLLPGTIVTSTTRNMSFCIVNQGGPGALVPGEDAFIVAIPVGPTDTDFLGVASVACVTTNPKWACSTMTNENVVQVILEPSVLPETDVTESEAACVQLQGMQVNAVPGLTISHVTQEFVPNNKASAFLNPSLPVFKTEEGLTRHDDLADVTPDQHHVKTTSLSFTDLTDEAADAQIPNTITVDYAAEAGAIGPYVASDLVTDVTAASPLSSTGGTTPLISLPNVLIDPSVPFNTAIGNLALSKNTGSGNTAAGYHALVSNTEGFSNTALGSSSLRSNTTGDANTATGSSALRNNETGSWNTATGVSALNNSTAGSYNTASGSRALFSNTEGSYNTATGSRSLENNTTGSNNTAFGFRALFSNVEGSFNFASGSRTLENNTTGSNNTASGFGTLYANTTGSSNTATGHRSLYSNTEGSDNTAAGDRALENNTTGYRDTAMGSLALQNNTTGWGNVAVGDSSMSSNTTGFANTVTGSEALRSNTTGYSNSAYGQRALQDNETGRENTAIGSTALWRNTIGVQNTAVGVNALISNTEGSLNTATGWVALRDNTTGSSNTANGYRAMQSNDTGSNNTVIGAWADVAAGDLTNATALGAGAWVNTSNKVRIGNSLVTVIEGQVPFTAVSDRNQKENFKPLDAEQVLRKLREVPVQSWNYIGHDPEKFRHYGPVAQDFFAAFGHDGVGTVGSETTINSGDLAGILMAAVKELEKRTRDLGERDLEIQQLKARLQRLEQLFQATILTTADRP